MNKMIGQGRNIITVAVCSKCGRGFIGKSAKDAAIDTQPVWWWGERESERGLFCNGQIMHIDRVRQLDRIAEQLALENLNTIVMGEI